ncbi:MAG: hypothetical protein ACM34I_03490 [bacterium]
MRHVCAWCRKELSAEDPGSRPDDSVSHGICQSCADNLFFQMGEELLRFLDSLRAPVLVVNSGGWIKTANAEARKALGKELTEIEDRAGGIVFECAYARLPEGCGNTVHCSGCVIRRTVMKTFETGKSFLNTPAILNHGDPLDTQKIPLRISTERMGGVVLLRIDEMGSAPGSHTFDCRR